MGNSSVKKYFDTINPATEEQIGIVAMGNVDDVNLAVSAAKAAFDKFSQSSKTDRLKLLQRIKEITKKFGLGCYMTGLHQ